MKLENVSLKRKSLYEVMADKLEEIILRDQTDEGAKLPSEQELAVQFSVSRTVVREALKLLKARGLITLKNGDGSYVSKPQTSTVSEAVTRLMAAQNIGNEDLYEVRRILEIAAAETAARRAEPADIANLRSILKAMEDTSLPVDERVAYDAAFHIGLAKAGKNELLTRFIEMLTMILKDYMAKGVKLTSGIEDGLKRHYAIIEAVESGDEAKTRQAMREHLDASRQNVLNYDREFLR